jgi:hypothetical protein
VGLCDHDIRHFGRRCAMLGNCGEVYICLRAHSIVASKQEDVLDIAVPEEAKPWRQPRLEASVLECCM